jgi:hypothetical protein
MRAFESLAFCSAEGKRSLGFPSWPFSPSIVLGLPCQFCMNFLLNSKCCDYPFKEFWESDLILNITSAWGDWHLYTTASSPYRRSFKNRILSWEWFKIYRQIVTAPLSSLLAS